MAQKQKGPEDSAIDRSFCPAWPGMSAAGCGGSDPVVGIDALVIVRNRVREIGPFRFNRAPYLDRTAESDHRFRYD